MICTKLNIQTVYSTSTALCSFPRQTQDSSIIIIFIAIRASDTQSSSVGVMSDAGESKVFSLLSLASLSFSLSRLSLSLSLS